MSHKSSISVTGMRSSEIGGAPLAMSYWTDSTFKKLFTVVLNLAVCLTFLALVSVTSAAPAAAGPAWAASGGSERTLAAGAPNFALNSANAISGTVNIYLPLVSQIPIFNAGFESGHTAWTEYSTHGWYLITQSSSITPSPHGGSWLVWLGGDDDEISYIQQQVGVPAGSPYLAYWGWIDSKETNCSNDHGGVAVNGSGVEVYGLCQSSNNSGWQKHVVNLSAYAGQSVALQIRVETNSSVNSNLFIDDLFFQSSAQASINDIAPAYVPGVQNARPKFGFMEASPKLPDTAAATPVFQR